MSTGWTRATDRMKILVLASTRTPTRTALSAVDTGHRRESSAIEVQVEARGDYPVR